MNSLEWKEAVPPVKRGIPRSYRWQTVIDGVTVYKNKTWVKAFMQNGGTVGFKPKKGQLLDECAVLLVERLQNPSWEPAPTKKVSNGR
jgi:hypothetical protein